MHWSGMDAKKWLQLPPIFSPSTQTSPPKAQNGPSTAVPLPAVAGPAKLTLTPPAVAPWFPSPGHGTDELQQRYPQSRTAARCMLSFEASHKFKWINTGSKLWSLQSIFWVLYFFFVLISLLFGLFFFFFLGFGGFCFVVLGGYLFI